MDDNKLQYFCDTNRHLVCYPYSVANLHKMAEDLDLKRSWYHSSAKYKHYDVPKRRIDEITDKCTIVSTKTIIGICKGMKLTHLKEAEQLEEVLVLKAPERFPSNGYKGHRSVFLAGSIDMGKAEDWQTRLTNELVDSGIKNIAVFNPRRDDWDSSWKQSIDDPKFNEQVTWEMDHLDEADVIAMYFDPKGQAPISLLELGLHAADGKMIVCCPDGFWRKGNVEMVCDRHDIPLVNTIEELIEKVKEKLKAA